MDTSKEYIKMCKKAEEIRKDWKPESGDYCVGKENSGYIQFGVRGIPGKSACFDNEANYYEEREDIVFLPRQDQCQEMFDECDKDEKKFEPLEMFAYLTTELIPRDLKYFKQFNSMEQLWLAFTMVELYQKKWDGKEWIGE